MVRNNKERLNLKNDIVFREFFGRKGNEEFLIDFLNALLKIQIVKIEIKNDVNLGNITPETKGGRIDIQAELNDGIIVDIEMQVRNNHNIEERTTFYASKIISKETEKGRDYKEIKQVIVINILDYELLGFDEYISETEIVLKEHKDYEVIKGMKWYFIELPKFRRIRPDMDEGINQWLAFIDDYDRGLVEMAEKKNKTLKKAREEVTYLTGDEAVQRWQELKEKWEMDRISEMNYLRSEATKQGLEEGRKKGIEEGRKEGRKEGIKEGIKQNKIEIAKAMKEKNIDIKTISEITGLLEENIIKL